MREMASILAPALKGDRPSNLFIYGKTGTGKTLITRRVTDDMERIAKEKAEDMRIVSVEAAEMMVMGTARSMGVDIVEGG